MRRKLKTSLLSIAIFIFLAASFSFHVSREFLPSNAALNSASLIQPIHHLTNNAVRELHGFAPRRRSSPPIESVLLLDWEVLVLLPPNSSAPAAGAPIFCLFHTGDASPAWPTGRSAFRCTLPNHLRRIRPFYTPRLTALSAAAATAAVTEPRQEMIRWSSPIAYESVSYADDVVVFAKGINRRKGTSLPAADIQCVFSPASGGAAVATTAVTSSAQEVFRCPHPPAGDISGIGPLRVSLSAGQESAPISSVAYYQTPRESRAPPKDRARICACTMVYNAAKFLHEWVAYHAGVGVERFFIYDNGSEDALESVVARLGSEGFNLTVRNWPWPKTQEAGFSHCAATNRDECEWMAFVDVDEFVFSPGWTESDRPNRAMMGALVEVPSRVGQVSISCLEFGPSGQPAHPNGGVTQGYTCRRRQEERHKSLLRLNAVDYSLLNTVHHFELRDGYTTKWVQIGDARVYHYKYQVWDEFKGKFRRRVSTYVADWKESVNLGSRDRAPGLGSEPVEPTGWSRMFCEVNDTLIRDTTRKWFGTLGDDGSYRMAWQKQDGEFSQRSSS